MTQISPASSPFSIPLFRNMWIASMASNLGAMIQTVGAAWLMTTLSSSSLMVALVQASSSLPVMLLALWAGAVADNLDRRRVMLASQVFMLIASTLLASLAYFGGLNPLALLALTFLIGCGTALNWPAMQVAFSDFVPAPLMPKAVALNGMGLNLARSIGPAIGGGIIAAFGAAATFTINALSYFGLIAVLLRWRYKPAPRIMPREPIGAAMIAGLRYAAMSPMTGIICLRSLSFGFTAGTIPALMPVIARDLVKGGPLTFGLLLGAFGLGAVGGAFASGRIRSLLASEQIVRNACILIAAGAFMAGFSSSLPLTLAAMAMAGAAWLIVLSTFNVTMQLASPRWVVARALSLYQMATYGGMAAGSWMFGWIAEHHGSPVALYCAGAGLILVAAAGLIWPIRSHAEANLGPRSGWEIPETKIDVELRSGPIVLTIEHRVREQDAVAFLNLMAERSRIVRRDGARRWTLLRDLADTELWIERYQLPTWLDYVLLNRRRTQADVRNQEALHALHIPGTGLVVHRMIERQVSSPPWSRIPDPSEPPPTDGPPIS